MSAIDTATTLTRKTGQKDKIEEGFRIFKEYLIQNPNDISALYAYACALDYNAREIEACEIYKKVFASGFDKLPVNDQPDFLLGFGSTLRNVKDNEKSIEVLETAIKVFPEHWALKSFLALSYYTGGKFQKASQLLFTIMAFSRNDPTHDDFKRAFEWYVERLDTYPNPPKIESH